MTKNPKERKITVEALLVISLEELAFTVLKHEQDKSMLFDMLNKQSEVVNSKVEKIARRMLLHKKSKVKLKELKFAYTDSERFTHGVAFFNARLYGTEKELRKALNQYPRLSYQSPLFFGQ